MHSSPRVRREVWGCSVSHGHLNAVVQILSHPHVKQKPCAVGTIFFFNSEALPSD